MKTKRALVVVGVIGVLALLSGVYCAWLMTVPLDYDLIWFVVIGFIVSFVVFVSALISSVIIAIQLGRARPIPPVPPVTPTV